MHVPSDLYDYTLADSATVAPATPADVVAEMREWDAYYFERRNRHLFDFSRVNGEYEPPLIDAQSIPGGAVGVALKKTLRKKFGDRVFFFEDRAFLMHDTPCVGRPSPELAEALFEKNYIEGPIGYSEKLHLEASSAGEKRFLSYITSLPSQVTKEKGLFVIERKIGDRVYRAVVKAIDFKEFAVTYAGSVAA